MENENSIKKNINLIENSWCESCKYCSAPSFDYEWWYIEPWYCNKWDNSYWNLKSFPFKKHKDCFKPDLRVLIWIDSDISDLHDKSFNLDMKWHIDYSNWKISLNTKKELEKKSREIVEKMKKLATERYWF